MTAMQLCLLVGSLCVYTRDIQNEWICGNFISDEKLREEPHT